MSKQYPASLQLAKELYDENFDEFMSAFSDLVHSFPALKKTRDRLVEICSQNVEPQVIELAKLEHINALRKYHTAFDKIEPCHDAMIEARSAVEKYYMDYKQIIFETDIEW